jgi:uncharacterized protein YndB with AHSA1/START domain
MIEARATVSIARPPAEVFALLTDVQNQPLWHHRALRAASDGPEPLGVGSTWSAVVHRVPPPGVRHLHFTVTELVPNERLMSWTRSLPYEMGTGCELTPENGHTRVVCIRTVKLRGLWRLVRPLIQSILNRDIVREAADLKHVLESRVPAPQHERL